MNAGNMYYDDYTIMIYGKSKSGKSMSLRNLPREEMSYINVEAKPLSIRGGKRLARYSEPSALDEFMEEIKASTTDEKVKFIIIDSITKLGDEMVYNETVKAIISEKGKKFGMEGWQEYKDWFTGLLKFAKRSNKHFIFIGLEDQMDNAEDAFEKEICIAIQGATKKKLISDFTNVFRSTARINSNKELEYVLQTRRTATDPYVQCGSLECFDDYEPNDLEVIFSKMEKYYSEDID